MGAFDDLIPKPSAPSAAPALSAPGGAFNDLVPKPEQPGMAMSAARGAVQGLTFGLADESYGLMKGIGSMMSGGSFREAYDKAVDQYRANDKAAKEANPISSVTGELVGGMGTGLGLARSGATLVRQGMTLRQMVGAGAIEGAAYGAAYGAGNAEGGLPERLQGGAEGAWTGAAVGAAVPLAARAIGAGVQALRSPMAIPAERQAAVDILAREGVPTTAGQRSGSKALQYGESFLGDAPFAGGQASRAMEQQGEAFTDAAMRRIGASGRATPDALSAARDRIGQQFTDLSARNVVTADRQMAQELGRSLSEYDRVLPAEQRRIVGELASDIVQRFQAGNGTMAGADYQTIRSRLSRMAQNARVNDPEFSQAIRSMRDALDNNMGRSITPEDAAAWQQARREYGNLRVLEHAAAGAGENAAGGLISPQQLRVAASQRAGNRSGYARGQGDFAEIARAGSQIMAPLPNSGTAQRNMMTGMVGAGGGASVATGDPLWAALVAAGPAVAGRVLMSPMAQAYFGNRPMPPAARAAIEGRIRAMIQGGAGSQSQKLN